MTRLGYQIPNFTYPGVSPDGIFDNVVAKAAEAAGYDRVLVMDHFYQDMEPLQHAEVDVAQQGARMLSAHEARSSLREENRELFLDVVESLRSDLDQSNSR